MAGRHVASSRRRRRLGVVVLAVAVVGATVAWGVTREAASDACDRSSTSVAAAPDIAEALGAAVRATASSTSCRSYDITSTPSVTAADVVAGGGASTPDLWVPDSATWLARAASEGERAPDVVARAVATTPVVLVGASTTPQPPGSWLDVLREGELRLGNALTSSPAAAALVAARTEAGDDASGLSAALVPLAQAEAEAGSDGDPGDLVRTAAEGDTRAVVSEQQWLRAREKTPALAAAAPASTPFLDHPVAVTAPTADRDGATAAARELVRRLGTSAGLRALESAGFRTTATTPPEGGLPDLEPSDAPAPAVAEEALRSWALLALPPRALAVIDVSGSMRERAGDSSRIGLTIEAAARGRRLFQDNASLGLWAFSVGLGRGGRDFLPLVPVRRMDADVDGRTQREVLDTETASLAGRTGGGTGLYDTVLAAYRTQQESYDPRAVNSVIVLTDGENEDPGSLTLRELLDTLEREADPARPVVVVAIGITEDADSAALSRIARATGGTSFVARSPSDITSVFTRALQARTG